MPAFETGTASGASEASEQNGVFWRQIPETDLAVYNAAEREKIVQVYTNLMERNARRIMEYLASAPRDATLVSVVSGRCPRLLSNAVVCDQPQSAGNIAQCAPLKVWMWVR